jgi:hypothetical protein
MKHQMKNVDLFSYNFCAKSRLKASEPTIEELQIVAEQLSTN